MALTRKALKGMGLTEEQIDTIIELHTDTVDGIKADLDKAQADAKDLAAVRKELEETKKLVGDGDGYKKKYEELEKTHKEFEAKVKAEKDHGAKDSAYRALLKEAGIAEKRIDTIVKATAGEIDKLELADGKVKDAEDRLKAIKTEWADFIVQQNERGQNTPNPPAGGDPGAKAKMPQFF